MALGYLAMSATAVLWLLSGKAGFYLRQVRKQPVVWIAGALYAVILLWCFHPGSSREYVFVHLAKYAKLLMLPIFISLLSDARWRRLCMSAYVCAMLLILASVYANIWIDLPWSKTHNQGWGIDHTVIGDYITQSIMMSFFVIIALDRGLKAQKIGLRGFWWIIALLAAISISHLSNGRTGYVLLFASIFAFVMSSVRGYKRWLVLGALVASVMIVALTSITAQERFQLALEEAKASDRMELTSIGGRINFWKNTWRLIEERPITGWGTGSYHEQWCRVVPTPDWCEFGHWHPHNQFLFFWVEHGLLGLLLFAALVFSPVWASRRATPEQRGFLLSFAAIFLIDSMINASLWSSRENHFFIFMLAWVTADAMFARSPGRDAGSDKKSLAR